MSYKEQLAEMQDTWTERSEMGFSQVADGTYDCRLQNAELGENSEGNLQIHCEYLIYTGPCAGQVIHDWIRLAGDWGPSFCKRWVEVLGFGFPDDPTEIEELVSEISEAAPPCRIKVTTKGDFTNARILRLLEEDDLPSEPEAAEDEEEEKPKRGGKKPSKTDKKPKKEEQEEEEEEEEDEDEGETAPADDADEAPSYEKGDIIKWEYEGKPMEGKVIKVLLQGDRWRVKGSNGKVTVVTAADLAEDEDEEEQDEDRESLIEFLEANGIEFDEQDAEAVLIKRIKKAVKAGEIEASSITAEEKTLLETIGAEIPEEEEEEKEEEEEEEKPKRSSKTEKPAARKPAARKPKETAAEADEEALASAKHILKTYTNEKAPRGAKVGDIIALLKEYEWSKKDMSPEDVKALSSLGIRAK